MYKPVTVFLAPALLVLVGCQPSAGNAKFQSNPSEISVESALASIGSGLSQMRKAVGEYSFGLLPSEITMELNLSAGKDSKAGLVIDASPAQKVSSAKLDASVALTSSRSNKITIVFRNIVFQEVKTPIFLKDPNGSVKPLMMDLGEWKSNILPEIFDAPEKEDDSEGKG